jgi:hypothetical protein
MMANSRVRRPIREVKMTEANKIQTNDWLGSLYADLLQKTSEARG